MPLLDLITGNEQCTTHARIKPFIAFQTHSQDRRRFSFFQRTSLFFRTPIIVTFFPQNGNVTATLLLSGAKMHSSENLYMKEQANPQNLLMIFCAHQA